MITLIAFMVTIGILVTIHELGHYLMARWCGVTILKFSIGFGKAIWQRIDKRNTVWVLSAIPLGGYVKMLDERESESDEHAALDSQALAGAFNRKAVWQRILIVLAGPAANILFAIAVYWVLLMMGSVGLKPIIGEIDANSVVAKSGMRQGDLIVMVDQQSVRTWQEVQWALMKVAVDKNTTSVVEVVTQSTQAELAPQPKPSQAVAFNDLHRYQLSLASIALDESADILTALGLNLAKPKIKPIVGEVVLRSPASKAGIQAGDLIISMNGQSVTDWQEIVKIVQDNVGKPIRIKLKRHNHTLVLKATPEVVMEQGVKQGRLGAVVDLEESVYEQFLTKVHYGPSAALMLATEKTYETARFSLVMLKKMVVGEASLKSISGPLTIANVAGESAGMGLKSFLNFLALVSISIGVLNLLPIPVLDGGHLMYYIVEIIRGAPLPDSVL